MFLKILITADYTQLLYPPLYISYVVVYNSLRIDV